jgi:hypothetical protein
MEKDLWGLASVSPMPKPTSPAYMEAAAPQVETHPGQGYLDHKKGQETSQLVKHKDLVVLDIAVVGDYLDLNQAVGWKSREVVWVT